MVKDNHFFILFFVISGCFQLFGMLIAHVDIHNPKYNQSLFQTLVTTFFYLIGAFISVIIVRKYVDKNTFASLGLRLSNQRDIILGLAIGFLIMLSGFTLLLVLKQITANGIKLNVKNFLMSILTFVFVSITEELVVRGYVLNTLMSSMNKYLALLISAIIFSLLHSFNSNVSLYSLLNLLLAGVLLGLSYLYTKNLTFSIALHFSWNFCQGTLFGFNVSGTNFYSLYTIKLISKNYLNGGDFGFENSIFCMLFQVIAIFIVYKIFSKTKTHESFQNGFSTDY